MYEKSAVVSDQQFWQQSNRLLLLRLGPKGFVQALK